MSDGQNIQKAEREKEEETLDGDKVDRFFCLQRVSEIQIITAMTRLSGCHLQWKGVKLSIVPCQSCLYCTIGSDSTAKPLKGAPVNIFNRLYWYEVGYGSFFFCLFGADWWAGRLLIYLIEATREKGCTMEHWESRSTFMGYLKAKIGTAAQMKQLLIEHRRLTFVVWWQRWRVTLLHVSWNCRVTRATFRLKAEPVRPV